MPIFQGVVYEKGTHVGEVDRRGDLTWADFREDYLFPKKPVVLTGAMDSWRARGEWTFDFFRDRLGSVEVPVGVCFESRGKQSFAEYVDYLDSRRGDEPSADPAEFPLYMEGWYFLHDHPELAEYFSYPACFGEDWFNRYFPKRYHPMGTGLLMGPAGSYTKLHYDGQGTHNWLAQVVGRKHWTLIEPGEVAGVFRNKQESAGGYPGIEHPDLERYLDSHSIQYRTTVLEPGEILFFPSKTYHAVVSLDATISLTHNFFNRTNAMRVYWEAFLLRCRGLRKRA